MDGQSEQLMALLGEEEHQRVLSNVAKYQELLERLGELDRQKENVADYAGSKEKIEEELRKQGHQMVCCSEDLVNRLWVSVSEALLRSRVIHICFIALMLIFVIFNAYILGSRILGGINRFTEYAQRIAAGDFTPIRPARRFRDEFTVLALAINQMIQELARREEGLIQLHKVRAVGTLTAGIAHELNNPLNNIMLSAHMMLEEYGQASDEDMKEILNDIVSETDRSKNIISNLLDFARQSSSQIEPLDLVALVEDTLRLSSNQMKLAGIGVDFQATDNLPQIHGDIQQLQQVFLNLILNAIDASKKGDKIQVFVVPADEPNYVAVKFLDFGSGIPEHVLTSIFDPFFTTKGKGRGTGLGLSVSQGIITRFGGRIQVSSREGQGSIFTVTLPVTTIPADISSARNDQTSTEEHPESASAR